MSFGRNASVSTTEDVRYGRKEAEQIVNGEKIIGEVFRNFRS